LYPPRQTIYTEKEARELCRILFSALAYCHAENIVHRDIKVRVRRLSGVHKHRLVGLLLADPTALHPQPQNLLMVSPSCDSRCKVADFGFAVVVPDGSKLSAKCGSP
jgi:serine/threonine protein kinase